MADIDPHDRLIRSLSAELTPVRRLSAPGWRALLWIVLALILAAVIASRSDFVAFQHKMSAASDLWIALAGSSLTAVLAAIAAFELSVPGRSKNWAWLPLPGALLWIGASGAGCLRSWIVPGLTEASAGEAKDCFIFILSVSVPLSAIMIFMLRRAYSLYPVLTACMAGLACASAAASLISFFHPFDVAGTDLAIHAAAIAVVVGLNALSGGFLLGGGKLSSHL